MGSGDERVGDMDVSCGGVGAHRSGTATQSGRAGASHVVWALRGGRLYSRAAVDFPTDLSEYVRHVEPRGGAVGAHGRFCLAVDGGGRETASAVLSSDGESHGAGHDDEDAAHVSSDDGDGGA
jgi:hypothetical protein